MNTLVQPAQITHRADDSAGVQPARAAGFRRGVGVQAVNVRRKGGDGGGITRRMSGAVRPAELFCTKNDRLIDAKAGD